MNLIMRLLSLSVLVVSLTSRISLAQETFKIQNASQMYDLTVRVESCGGEKQNNDANHCGGSARVSIYRKGAKSPFQVLNLPNVEVYKDQMAYNSEASGEPRKLYDDEYSFIFGDYNFDGLEDLAICNGRNGGYGAPSYKVYLFDKSKRFVENRKFSRLTRGVYLGLFFVEPKKKELVAFSKSGCCYHETEKYKVINNSPVLVEKIIEEAGEDVVKVTTRRLRNGRWIKRVSKERSKQTTPQN
jgi:hypothetical protein